MTDPKTTQSHKSAGKSKSAGGPITIKKYANRRLYNTGTSTYVTLDDLAELVKTGDDFVVVDAKTGEDITRSVLTQIIFEQESRGGNMLPVSFLRQLIGFYGDQMQSLVPSYLDFTMQSLSDEQDSLRKQMTRALGTNALEAMEEQTRRNMAVFEQAMRVFSPFAPTGGATPGAASDEQQGAVQAAETPDDEIDDLKKELADMQAKLDRLAKS